MNKILNINLGGYALTIDDDAHAYLAAYLENISSRFSESDGREEIMRDVEARMGELITQEMGARTIVMLPAVESAVEIMGKPEDFGGEPAVKQSAKQTPSVKSILDRTILSKKKLYRDEQDDVIGGVCSGLAAYFNFHDTVWMRLIFVLFTLVSSGFGVLVYILLWIIVPPARTTNERLAMRGEPINVDTIAKEFESGSERTGNRVGAAVNNVSGGCLTVFGKLLIGLFILIGIGIIFGLGTGWVAGIIGFITVRPYLEYFSPYSMGTTYYGFLCGFFLLGLPVIGLCLLLARMVFRFTVSRWLILGIVGTWITSLVSIILLVGFGFNDFKRQSTVSVNEDCSSINSDTLRVEWADTAEEDRDGFWWHDDGMKVRDGHLEINGHLEIRVRKSTTNNFECSRMIEAFGPTSEAAQQHATDLLSPMTVADNTIKIPTIIKIPEGRKYRIKWVKVNLNIPVGKYVVFGKTINNYVQSEAPYNNHDDFDNYFISQNPDRVYKMTEEGLVCADCPALGDKDFRSNRSYEDFSFEGDFEVEIRQGDEERIELLGSEAFKKSIETPVSRDNISFVQTTNTAERGKIRITTRDLNALKVEKCPLVILRGFDVGDMRISAKKSAVIKADIIVNSLEVFLDGGSTLELDGRGNSMEAVLANASILNAGNWRTDNVEITANDASKARVYARGNATVRNDPSSNVRVEGSAEERQ